MQREPAFYSAVTAEAEADVTSGINLSAFPRLSFCRVRVSNICSLFQSSYDFPRVFKYILCFLLWLLAVLSLSTGLYHSVEEKFYVTTQTFVHQNNRTIILNIDFSCSLMT